MYYLTTLGDFNKPDLMIELKYIIFDDPASREKNIADIVFRLNKVLKDPRFTIPFGRAKRHNWLEVSPDHAIMQLLNFLRDCI